MELKQLLSPEVLGWIEKHEHLEGAELFNEYEKWFFENEEKINESVNNNLEKINECIEKGKIKSKNSRMLLEALVFGDEDDEDDEDEDDSGYTEEDVDDDNPEEDIATVDSLEDDDEKPSTETEWADDEDDEPITKTADEKESDKSYVTTGTLHMDSVKDEELKEKIYDEAESLSGKLTIKLSDDNLYDAINAAFIALEETNMLNKKNSVLWSSFDTSNVTNMTALFAFAFMPNADLSKWNTSKVKTMEGMFYRSNFNNDSICDWNVSSCTIFDNMFLHSNFNQDISLWETGTIYVVDEYGIPVIDPKTGKQLKRKAPLPFIGASKDEKAERAERAWVNKYKKILSPVSENINHNIKPMKHILDFDTFINEGFVDVVKKGFNKIKSFFKNISIKLGDFIEVFDNKGNFIEATSPYTSLNLISNGDIKGVTAFSKVKNNCLNDNVQSIANLPENPEYYGILDKNSVEYKNYQTMVRMINEHYAKYNEDFTKLNESDEYGENERVGFTSTSGGLKGIPDIKSEELEEELDYIIRNVPGRKRKPVALCIWGAPGIGKSTIPNAVIKSWNRKNPDELKSLMVVECGNLTVDGFSLPMPVKKSMKNHLKEHPLVLKKIEDMGEEYKKLVNDEEFLKKLFQVSDDAPKTWLPAYRVGADEVENKVRNDIANGHIFTGYDENGKFKVTETTGGGIIIFDEWLRANPQVFNILMQIVLNREFSGYRIGDMWGILCCSNRPGDDPAISDKLSETSVVGFNRVQQYNFIPSFDEWKEWAIKDGGFDPITISFLQSDIDPKTKEYVNWHTVIPEDYKEGYTAWATPRSWSMAMEKINNIKEDYGTISDDKLYKTVGSFVGLDVADKYMKFLKSRRKSLESFEVTKFLSDPGYFPKEISYEDEFGDIKKREVLCYEITDLLNDHISSSYTKKHLPSDKQMVMMFDKLEDHFKKQSVQKYLTSLYIKILSDFTGLNDKKMDFKEFKSNMLDVNSALPNFIEKIVEKYEFYNSGKPSLKMIYTWLAPWSIQ